MNKAEAEDIGLGIIYGALTIPVIGYWALVSIPACSYLYWKGGRSGNSYQMYGCSTAAFLPMMLIKANWYVGIPWVAFGVLVGVGYGIPDGLTDEGSRLGRFYFKMFKGDLKLTNLFTRGTLYLGILACFVTAWVI